MRNMSSVFSNSAAISPPFVAISAKLSNVPCTCCDFFIFAAIPASGASTATKNQPTDKTFSVSSNNFVSWCQVSSVRSISKIARARTVSRRSRRSAYVVWMS